MYISFPNVIRDVIRTLFCCRYLAAGSSNAVKLSKFFDRVIESKLTSGVASPVIHNRDAYFTSHERKRNYSPSRMFAPKSSHLD